MISQTVDMQQRVLSPVLKSYFSKALKEGKKTDKTHLFK